jgi:hypothetical protein
MEYMANSYLNAMILNFSPRVQVKVTFVASALSAETTYAPPVRLLGTAKNSEGVTPKPCATV